MSGSYYTLNSKYNQLLALIQKYIATTPVGTQDLASVLGFGDDALGLDITGLNNLDVVTINSLPYPPTAVIPTINQVLGAGSTSVDKTQTFSATGSPTTTNIDDAEVEIIDGTSGINSKLEYDNLSLTGTYALYATNNVVSNTGMVLNLTDTLNNFQYITNATNTDLNIQRQITASNITETTGANFADGIFYQTNDTFTSPLDNTKLSLKASSTAGTITCFNPTTSTSAPLDFQASALTLNGAPITSPTPDLNAVLGAGNNALGNNILGVSNIDLSTINSSPYPPPSSANLNNVLTNGNNAGSNNIDMNLNNILNCNNINTNTINNLSPTTLGLNWADFTGINAYANLPSSAYQVTSGSGITSQYTDKFEVYNPSAPSYTTINSAGMDLLDVNSATTTSYGTNNISSTNATAFTITAGTSSSQPLNLNCSQLVINGVVYSPPRQIFYSGSGGSLVVSSGGWNGMGTLYTFSGLTPFASYFMGFSFSVYCDVNEGTASLYPNFYNSNGAYPAQTFNLSRPAAQIGSSGTWSGGTSQFVINDFVSFSADAFGNLYLEPYIGFSGGSWSINYNWTLVANILFP